MNPSAADDIKVKVNANVKVDVNKLKDRIRYSLMTVE